MLAELSPVLSLAFMAVGLAALAWSSGFFVDGSAALARAFGISPLIVGMVVIGFGTSAPELCVSTMSGLSGHANLSLGNAYGSCIFNIAIILGVAVLIRPLVVRPSVVLVAGPCLALLSLFSLWLLRDGACARAEAFALLGLFFVLLPLYCWHDQKTAGGRPACASAAGRDEGGQAPERSVRCVCLPLVRVLVGLSVLVGSSHVLVWGAVDFARYCGVSDLVVGLTIVAVGTSLPELASAVASARRGEHEFVLGNIIGSNLFNLLAVVGLATAISPLFPGPDGRPALSPYILTRDLPLMALLSLSLLCFGLNWRHPRQPGTIRRWEAWVWIVLFAGYSLLMFWQETR
ncbi:MAG: calcium/sodium antiporter [Kiritimatiellia bacterium]